MDTAGDRERPPASNAKQPALLAGVVAATVIAFGLLTTLAPDRNPLDDDASELAALLGEPETDATFRIVTELDEGPWESYRINDAYLYIGDGPTVITDEDEVLAVDLPELAVLFGAFSAGEESIAFGGTPDGPALWRSTDNLSWELEPLPWNGTVRAGAVIDGRLVLIGIESQGPSFTYVVATESPEGWLVVDSNRIPDSGLVSVPGGFVGRGTATDGGGYGYLYSDDAVDWRFQSFRAVSNRSGGHTPAFVIDPENSPLLTLPGDDRLFTPPGWPVSGVSVDGDTIWIQTPGSAWSSTDGIEWTEYPINSTVGVTSGFSVMLPVGDTIRLAASLGNRIVLLRWDPGTATDN